jgi:hypothetical protein
MNKYMEKSETEENSYKFLETRLKPYINYLYNEHFTFIGSIDKLEELLMKIYYEYSKDRLDNLLPLQTKFYNLLIKMGRAKELLADKTEGIKLKTVIGGVDDETFTESIVSILKEYVDIIIERLKNHVIWLINEYNDLNPDKRYTIEEVV